MTSAAGLPAFLIYGATAGALTGVYLVVYTLATAHDELALIRRDVTAASVALGSSLVGFALLLTVAIFNARSIVDCLVRGLLAHLWAMAPGHPNLLPTFVEDDPAKAPLGDSFVRKPLYPREGANILLVRDGAVLERDDGPYGGEGFVRQALAELPAFDGRHALVGSWIVGDEPAGLCLREEERRITTDRARFVPHLIEG